MVRLEPIDAARIDAAWPTAEAWIRAACRRPGCTDTAEDLRALVAAEEGALLLLHDGATPIAAGITQVRDYRSGRRSLWILAAGGSDLRAFRVALTALEAGGARVGCHTIEFVGRAGWAALLPDYAAAACETGVHFSKSLRH